MLKKKCSRCNKQSGYAATNREQLCANCDLVVNQNLLPFDKDTLENVLEDNRNSLLNRRNEQNDNERLARELKS